MSHEKQVSFALAAKAESSAKSAPATEKCNELSSESTLSSSDRGQHPAPKDRLKNTK